VARPFAKVGQAGFRFAGENDPGSVPADGDHARAADFTHRLAKPTKTVTDSRTVVVHDPFARANVLEALAGPGAPAGVTSCVAAGETIELHFDAQRTPPELIDDLIAIELSLVPALAAVPGDATAAAAGAARGLDEPALDRSRIIETYLP
jgi:hypothetical protein